MELPDIRNLHLKEDHLSKIHSLIQQSKLALSCCELCQGHTLVHPLLCKYCLADLPAFDLAMCQEDLLNWPATNKLFPRRHFDHLLAFAPYTWPINGWLKQLKFHNRFELADLLGFLLSELWQQTSTNHQQYQLLSVPTHIKHWQNRGYNQAHLIARAFAKYSSIPYLPRALIRHKLTASQVGQSGRARRKNLNNAFSVAEHILPAKSHILLLDDIVTTGTTINVIAQQLKKQNVTSVTAICLALTLPR
ncbi:ComF family protein [Thalassotalea sp. G2M2-11]|uniref:ComF family protein n=1 Tax=Thalassotalea sp. G2M2-11 TaxID=2787627 RepID=UPI0019CF9AE5|nr:ComF family protein [Thalassotalea sp. G2M2-11]